MTDQRTLWVISYDISDDATRTRVQHALERVGERRQKSVFECRLNDNELDVVWRQLDRIIDHGSDSVLAWPLTRHGHEHSRSLGLTTVSDWDPPDHTIV